MLDIEAYKRGELDSQLCKPHQLRDFIEQLIGDLAAISKIVLDEDPVQGVGRMNNLRKSQDEILKNTTDLLKFQAKRIAELEAAFATAQDYHQ